MKLLSCILLILITAKECDKGKSQIAGENPSKMKLEKHSIISYQSATRGLFLKIWIEDDNITVSNDHTLKRFKTYSFPSSEKEAFINLLNDIDRTTLPNLEAPSKNHQFDGAQMAWLEISEGDTIYKTQVFDHGNPPKAISKFIDKVLSLKTMVENQ